MQLQATAHACIHGTLLSDIELNLQQRCWPAADIEVCMCLMLALVHTHQAARIPCTTDALTTALPSLAVLAKQARTKKGGARQEGCPLHLRTWSTPKARPRPLQHKPHTAGSHPPMRPTVRRPWASPGRLPLPKNYNRWARAGRLRRPYMAEPGHWRPGSSLPQGLCAAGHRPGAVRLPHRPHTAPCGRPGTHRHRPPGVAAAGAAAADGGGYCTVHAPAGLHREPLLS